MGLSTVMGRVDPRVSRSVLGQTQDALPDDIALDIRAAATDDGPVPAEGIAGEILAELGVPVIAGLPVGHGAVNHAFPWGAPARVEDATLSWV